MSFNFYHKFPFLPAIIILPINFNLDKNVDK